CKNYPSEYAISEDNAETFSEAQQTGFEAETCKLLALRDGRIFCAYRRADVPGLWGRVAELKGSRWVNLSEAPLWQGAASVTTSAKNSADGLSALKFGYPSLQQLPDGKIFLVFWCQEACITNIRWLKIQVS
ncbi:MAG: sialidase family protein, partial [Candidatus Acidiferrales bacterium]